MQLSLLEAESRDWLTGYTVCIIGTGIAGYEVARRLATNPAFRILMLESGDRQYHPFYQQLNRQDETAKQTRVTLPPSQSLPGSGNASRMRQLGGTLNVWSGKWKALEPYDFEPKPWHSPSGWPLTFQDLRPYYQSVITEYQLADHPDDLLTASEQPTLKRTPFYEEKPALQLTDWLDELSKRDNVTILRGATVSHLLVDENGHVRAAQLIRIDRQLAQAQARVFILATGGIENARILLNTPRIADRLPAIGKFYMDHPKAVLATVSGSVWSRQQRSAAPFPFWGLATQLLKEFALPNHSFALTTPAPAREPTTWTTLHQTGKQTLRRLARSLLGRNHLPITFHLEQLPSATSYVTLAPETDALGVAKAVLHWTFTDEEQQKLLRYLAVLAQSLQTAYGCTLHYAEETLHISQMHDASHHMGTTRMGHTTADSVVDPTTRVHGIPNLFVAGSSVFSTSGNANPTLTIAALSARLGDHLNQTIA